METKIMENETVRQQRDRLVQLSYLVSGKTMYEIFCTLESYELKDQILNHRLFRNRMTQEQNMEILKSYFSDPVVAMKKEMKEQLLEDYYMKRMQRDHTLTDPKVIADDYGRKFTNILVRIYSIQKDTLLQLAAKHPKKFSSNTEQELEVLEAQRKEMVHKWTDPLEEKVTDTFFKGGIYRIQDRKVQKAMELNLIHDFSADMLVGILEKLSTNETKKQLLEMAVAWGKLSLDDVQQVILTFDETPQVQLEKQLCETEQQKQRVSRNVMREQVTTFYHLVDTYPVLSSNCQEKKVDVKNSFRAMISNSSKTLENQGVLANGPVSSSSYVKQRK